jgi:hypothetical protein
MSKPKDMAKSCDLDVPPNCPLCDRDDCDLDLHSCKDDDERLKLQECHRDDDKNGYHSYCHKTNPLCHC